jgi:AraC-like DNA-binding protein
VAGDVVVMPYGDAYSLGSAEAADAVPVASLLPGTERGPVTRIRHGGGGAPTVVVCGFLRGEAVLFDPVLRALPALFVVQPTGAAAALVRAGVEFALSAPVTPVDRRLPELLFTEVLRLYLRETGDAGLVGWLAALRDPVAGPALSLLHEDPARDWTVTELARAVATSRTVLVDRFGRLLGRPPIRYLTEWRLNLAAGLLRTSGSTVGEVATRVGYTSEEAFSRAFKRTFGQTPTRWRA